MQTEQTEQTEPEPTEAEVLGYVSELSNWGRWGADDQRGTLNLITPPLRARAAALVREGESVSCAFDIDANAKPATSGGRASSNGVQRFMLSTGLDPAPTGRGNTATEYVGLPYHGMAITHIDALSHVFWDGFAYNGVPASDINTFSGATRLSVQAVATGIVTRGVLLDVAAEHDGALPPGTAVTPSDLERAESRQGVQVGPGDAVLLRTGAATDPDRPGHKAGWGAACLPWLRARDVSMIGCDGINDVLPSRYPSVTIPMHYVGIAAMGLWLIDNCNLEPLSQACEQYGRYEFLLMIAPLRLEGGTGSPVNPIAVF